MKRGIPTALALLLLSACAVDREELVPIAPARDALDAVGGVVGRGAVVDSDALPDDLTCVSAPLGEGGFGSDVLRISLFRDQASGKVTSWTQRGPQFWARNGEWFSGALPEARQHELSANEQGALVGSDALGTLTLSLQRDGHVFTGTVADDQCYSRAEMRVTCWSYNELFGSSWTGTVSTLPAHFDWSRGECLDADGRRALNNLPIEVVRETGNGECADLSGESLNGDDLGYPDLQGWFLPGAKLDGAKLFFANLTFATLNGTDVAGLDFGYATVSGSFDENTDLPTDGSCHVDENANPWSGPALTCTR